MLDRYSSSLRSYKLFLVSRFLVAGSRKGARLHREGGGQVPGV